MPYIYQDGDVYPPGLDAKIRERNQRFEGYGPQIAYTRDNNGFGRSTRVLVFSGSSAACKTYLNKRRYPYMNYRRNNHLVMRKNCETGEGYYVPTQGDVLVRKPSGWVAVYQDGRDQHGKKPDALPAHKVDSGT